VSVAAQAVSVTIVITSVISAMTLRTVPHRQAKLQAGVGMVVQIGRAVGPIFATELYEAGNYLINGSGGNIALAFGSIETIVGCLLPVLFAKHLFDFDPSGGKNEKGLGNTFEL
jgi:MFS family permease